MTSRNANLAALLFLAATSAVGAADGEFDPSFGTGSTVATGEISILDEPEAEATVFPLPGGASLYYGNTPFSVHRYTATGTLDLAFGMNGITPGPNVGQTVASSGVMAVGTDGTIYAAASTNADFNNGDVVVCKFTAQGQPTSFAATQTACTPIVNFADGFVPVSMAVDVGGGLVMLSDTGKLMRFLPNGNVDTAFAPPSGLFILPTLDNVDPDQFVRSTALTLDATGAIYVVGTDQTPAIARAYATKLRVNVNTGALFFDPAFNGGVPLQVPCGGDPALGCRLESVDATAGRLTITGTHGFKAIVARLNATSGQPVSPPFEVPLPVDAISVTVNDAALQHDNKLLILGTSSYLSPAPAQVWVARINLSCAAAALDTSNFSVPNGYVIFTFVPDAASVGNNISIGQGRFYVVGHDTNGPRAFAIDAFQSAGAYIDGIFADGFESCD